MGGGGNFRNFSKFGVANKLKWTEKIENSVIHPPTIRQGRIKVLRLPGNKADSADFGWF